RLVVSLGKTSGADPDHLARKMRGLRPPPGAFHIKQLPRLLLASVVLLDRDVATDCARRSGVGSGAQHRLLRAAWAGRDRRTRPAWVVRQANAGDPDGSGPHLLDPEQ